MSFVNNWAKKRIFDKAKQVLQKDIDQLEAGVELDSLDKYFPLAYDRFTTIFDYFENAPVFVSERLTPWKTPGGSFGNTARI